MLEEPDEVDAVPHATNDKFIGRLREVAFPAKALLLRYQQSQFCTLSVLKLNYAQSRKC